MAVKKSKFQPYSIWDKILLEKYCYDMHSTFFDTGGHELLPMVHAKIYYAPSNDINYTV